MKKQADPQENALSLLATLAATGFGTGMLGRSLLAARDASTPSTLDPLMHTSPVPTPVKIPIRPNPRKRRGLLSRLTLTTDPAQDLVKAAVLLQKVATEIAAPDWGKSLTDAWRSLSRAVVPTDVSPQAPLSGSWGIPAAFLAATGGLAGGWALTDAAATNNRKNVMDTAKQDAEEDFQQALAEQYRAAMRAKKAEDTFGIDELYATYVEKCAGAGDVYNALESAVYAIPEFVLGKDITGTAKGLVNTAALAGGLGGGYATYNWVKNRNKQKLLEKAIQLRARQRQFTPAPFYAVPETIAEAPGSAAN